MPVKAEENGGSRLKQGEKEIRPLDRDGQLRNAKELQQL